MTPLPAAPSFVRSQQCKVETAILRTNAQEPPPAPAPSASPHGTEGPEATSADAAAIDAILITMEAKGGAIRDLRCDLSQTREDRVNMAKTTRSGTLQLLLMPEAPLFLIRFDHFVEEGRVLKNPPKIWYLYRDRYLDEAMERSHHLVRREVLAPGEQVDFFDLEHAPFPLPFGQKKTQILKHFDVSLVAPKATDPPSCDHLQCIPKSDSRLSREYDQMDFYVHKSLGLPIRIDALSNNKLERTRVDFPGLSEKNLNLGLTPKDFDPPREWQGYKVTEEPLEPPAKP